jgi:hypothetical protein
MQQLWTIIFIILLGVGWGLAAWHDREEERRHHRKAAVYKKKENIEI